MDKEAEAGMLGERATLNGTHLAPESVRERRTYINNLLIEESLRLLPAALDHGSVDEFKAYLRNHLPQNSAKTRVKYAEYIAYRFSNDGRMNPMLAQFLAYCPDERARREALWFEMAQAVPPLRDLSGGWLAHLPEDGAPRADLLQYLTARAGERKVEKMATEAVGALRKLGHLRSVRLAHYQPVWAAPPRATLVYVLARVYPEPAAVRMESFKANPLWAALLWPAAELERLVVEAPRDEPIGRVTRLDSYYQFLLEGTGQERLLQLLDTWVAPVIALKAAA